MVFSNITLKFLALYNYDEVKFTEIFSDEIILLFFFFKVLNLYASVHVPCECNAGGIQKVSDSLGLEL